MLAWKAQNPIIIVHGTPILPALLAEEGLNFRASAQVRICLEAGLRDMKAAALQPRPVDPGPEIS